MLLIAVDEVPAAIVGQTVFQTTEDTRGYLMPLEGLVQWRGIPLALYSDRHAAFKYNAHRKPVPVENIQFARVMRELGIQQVYALCPQAMGRAKWMLETFQDRLVTELNLAAASTIDEAGLVLKESLLEAPGGVPGFPGGRSGPGLFSSGGHCPAAPASHWPLEPSPSVGRPA